MHVYKMTGLGTLSYKRIKKDNETKELDAKAARYLCR